MSEDQIPVETLLLYADSLNAVIKNAHVVLCRKLGVPEDKLDAKMEAGKFIITFDRRLLGPSANWQDVVGKLGMPPEAISFELRAYKLVIEIDCAKAKEIEDQA